MSFEVKKLLNNVDAILVSSVPNIKYLTGFTAFSPIERECFLLITKKENFLITDGRYIEAAKKSIKNFKIIDGGASQFISTTNPLLSKIKVLGVEESDLTVEEFKKIKKQVKKTTPINIANFRIVKNEKEIAAIKKACKISDLAFEFGLTKLKIGVSEKEVANEIVNFIRNIADNISFHPIVAFGKNASLPHHESGDTRLRKNTIVLFDLGVWKNNYCSDLSRTVFFGKADRRFIDIYQTVLEAQEKAIKAVRPGIKVSDIDKAARDHIIQKGYPDIIHSVGHGIGIEVHENPTISVRSNKIIQENMVFTIEPGIYLPGFGGVRIEDVIVVGKNKGELISHAIKEIIEV